MFKMEIIIAIVAIIIVCSIVLFVLSRNKNKKVNESPIDISKLIEALGGKANIEKVDSTPSTLKVTLKDLGIINIDEIKALGASGIVEGSSSITMIFGKLSSVIAQFLENEL